MLDQMLPKLKPIYEEYLRQKEAKAKYEPLLVDEKVKPRVAALDTSSFKKVEPLQVEIKDLNGKMDATANDEDYVDALDQASLAELDRPVRNGREQCDEQGNRRGKAIAA